MARKKQQPTPTGPLATFRPVLDRLVFALALFGVLVVVHLWIQSGRGFDRGCLGFSDPVAVAAEAAATGDCDVVTTSAASTFLGVSNIFWGLGFYLTLVALSFGVLLKTGAVRQRLKQARAGLIGFGVLFSAYLVYVQATQLGEYCVLCLVSASTVGLLAVLQAIDLFTSPTSTDASMQSTTRTREAGAFALAAVLVLVLAGADVAYFNQLEDGREVAARVAQPVAGEGEAAASTDDTCAYDPDKPFYADYANLVSFADPSYGNPEADVMVIEFFDPNCPHCRVFHPIMKQVSEQMGEQATFYTKPFPLWPYSVPQVEALYVAARQDKFQEMLNRQFQLQHISRGKGLSREQLLAIAAEIGMDVEVLAGRLQSGMFRSVILSDRNKAVEAGVSGTPAVMINGRMVKSSARTVDCLTELIEEAAAE